uniref:BZIP domain-containing protein n=1 Tax=Ganoderma boninense TaxID=34458 RepID=A0A5K1JVG2_9APHY|nr:BZIP domain-containing protein [Ganoderma boninense]
MSARPISPPSHSYPSPKPCTTSSSPPDDRPPRVPQARRGVVRPLSCCLPRLPALLDEPHTDQSNIIKIFPALQLPKTWCSPTATAPHPAISIRCPHGRRCACHPTRVPPSPFATLEPAHPQYFPLRHPLPLDTAAGMDPRSTGWTLDSLAGLWYGSYGAHGTEVLHVARGTAFWMGGMCATKLTGDVNVPRGAVSWVLQQTDEYGEDPAEFWAELREERPPRVLTGRGLLAARGFAESSVIGLIAAIKSPDEIQTFWAPLQVFRTYRRYKGREGEIHGPAQNE